MSFFKDKYTEIETERLLLKKITLDDTNRIYELRTNPEVMEYLGVNMLTTKEEAKNYILQQNNLEENGNSIYWGIYLKSDIDYLIGAFQVFNYIENQNSVLIGYYLDKKYRKKGLMREALIKAVYYIFKKLRVEYVEAQIDPRNADSIKLVEGCGFCFNRYNDHNLMYQQNRINFLSDYYNNKRKFKIYSLVTLNGKVANEDGVNSWIEKLPNPEQTDYEFNNFYDSIDTIILDEKMYDNIINNYETFPYVNKNAIVFTGNNSNYTDTNSIKFLKYSEIDKLQNKFNDEGKDIWVLSTGYVNSLLFKYNLIDEVNLYYIPIIAPKGIDITEIIPVEKYFRLKNGKTYKSGVVELKYVAGKIR